MNLWDKYEKIDSYLNKNLLTIPPYPSISGERIQELLLCLEEPDPSLGGLDGEVLRMVRHPWQRAYQIEYRFKPSKIFNDVMKVIESSTYDLMVGNYVCSYMSLVPVVEAVLRKWSAEKPTEIKFKNGKGHFSIHVFAKHLVEYLHKENNNQTSNSKHQKWIRNQIEYFDFIIREVFYENFKSSKEGVKKEFNRNRTLHLLDNIESSKTLRDNNTRIFLLLDIIAELYLSLDKELYKNNTFNAEPETNIDLHLRWKIYLKNAMELVSFTDMNILTVAFLNKDKSLSDEQKQQFIDYKNVQLDFMYKKM